MSRRRLNPDHPLARLRHHVTGAVERGEAEPIIGIPRCDDCDRYGEAVKACTDPHCPVRGRDAA